MNVATDPSAKPVIVTPDYDDKPVEPANGPDSPTLNKVEASTTSRPARGHRPKSESSRNPFDSYGERSSSRPYALRLPDPIDLVLRQMAAEERTHPLRIIDRILHDHLKKAGRLPPRGS